MSELKRNHSKEMANIMSGFDEFLDSLSDEEIREEILALGHDPDVCISRLNEYFLEADKEARKFALKLASDKYYHNLRLESTKPKLHSLPIDSCKLLIVEAIEQHPELGMAARDFDALDTDGITIIFNHLIDLGIIDNSKRNNGKRNR